MLRQTKSIKKGRFNIVEEEPGPPPSHNGDLSHGAQGGGGDHPLPRFDMRGLQHAAEVATQHAEQMSSLLRAFREQEDRVQSLVDENRWLRNRVAELERAAAQR